MDMKERRKHERFSLEVSAEIETGGNSKEIIALMTADISAGGAFLKTSKPLPPGTQVTINLVLPLDKIKLLRDSEHAVISATGTIVRTNGEGMSISFNQQFQILPSD